MSAAAVASLAAGGLLPALTTTAQTTATATFATTAAAPQDAVAYLNIPTDEESPQWALATELLDRAGFGEQLTAARDEALDGLPLDAFLGGEAALVVTSRALETLSAAAETTGAIGGDIGDSTDVAMPADGQGWAVVIDARAPDTTFMGLQEAVKSQAEESGSAVEESEYQGVPISYAPAAADDASSSGMAVARVDDLAMIASAPSDLEALIDTAQGTTPSLAELPGFGQVQSELPAEFLMFGFFNGSALNSGSYNAGDQLAGLGIDPSLASLNSQRYSGFTLSADPAGFRMESVAMNVDGTPIAEGAPNFTSSLADKAPGDAIFFASAADLGRAGAPGPDQPGLLETAGAVGIGVGMGMGSMSGEGSTAGSASASDWVAEQYAGLAALLGFNLQTDLLQQLTGEYGIWVTTGGGDPAAISALIASQVTDPVTVENALASITMLVAGASGDSGTGVVTRDVPGGAVSSLETGPGSPTVEYGVVDGNLLIGVGPGVDQFTGDGAATSALSSSERYQNVMANLPAEHNGEIYLDLGQLLPVVQTLSSSAGDMMSGMGETMTDADPSCGNFATQEEAQTAYDNFEQGTEMLDSDFDGTVCEDWFNPSAADASTEDNADAAAAASEAFQSLDLSAIEAFGLVAYEENGMRKSSGIITIAE
jgi:hypothetical protein